MVLVFDIKHIFLKIFFGEIIRVTYTLLIIIINNFELYLSSKKLLLEKKVT